MADVRILQLGMFSYLTFYFVAPFVLKLVRVRKSTTGSSVVKMA